MKKIDVRKLFIEEGWSLHCSTCGKDVYKNPRDYYMLKDEIWSIVCDNDYISKTDVLCRDCAEKILGRKFRKSDFTDAPVNISYVDANGNPIIKGIHKYKL